MKNNICHDCGRVYGHVDFRGVSLLQWRLDKIIIQGRSTELCYPCFDKNAPTQNDCATCGKIRYTHKHTRQCYYCTIGLS